MTGFFLKEKFSDRDEFDAVKAFFSSYFPVFLGKYTTEWLLLAEPDISELTPQVLNEKFNELKMIYARLMNT